jgi:hypothetical protein
MMVKWKDMTLENISKLFRYLILVVKNSLFLNHQCLYQNISISIINKIITFHFG